MSLFFEDKLNTIGGFSSLEETYTDNDMEAISCIECAEEDPVEALSRISLESVENFHNIMEAVAFDELACLESTGQELVYESGRIKGFADAIVKFVKNAYQKIKGAIIQALQKIEDAIKVDNPVIRKLKEKVKKDNFKGKKKFKGFEYGDISAVAMSLMKAVDKSVDGFESLSGNDIQSKSKDQCIEIAKLFNKKEVNNKAMGSIFGKDQLTRSEFNKELFKKFRNGKDKKVEISLTPDQVVTALEKSVNNKRDLKKIADTNTKSFKLLMNKAETIKKIKEGDDKETVDARLKLANILANVIKVKVGLTTTITKEAVRAIMSNYSQARAFAISGTTKATNESTVEYNGGSFLENVELI